MTYKKYLKIGIFAYIIALHLLLLFVLINSNFLDKISANVRPFFTDITPHYRQMVKYHRRIDASVAPESTLLIGDSLLQALPTSRLIAPAVNYGIGQDTTLGLLQRLPIYQSMATAETIILLIGINDLFVRDVSETVSNYRRVLEQLPECKRVIAVSLLPVDTQTLPVKLTNEEIDSFNTQLQTLIAERANTRLMDISQKLKNSKGDLDSRFHIGDGLHLNANGYDVMIAALNTHLETKQSVDDCG